MCAALIFCFERVIRCAMVVSGTKKAAAISATVRPPSSRRVRATRFSGASAGWQQVNTQPQPVVLDRAGRFGRVVS